MLKIDKASRIVRSIPAVVTAGMLLVLAPAAVATPPEGLAPPTILAAVSVPDASQVKVKLDGGFGEPRDVDQVVTARFELAPGGTFGWHRHPGPVVVSIVEGTLTVVMADGCMRHQYAAGQGFIEGGQAVHTAVNEGSTTVVLYATFLLPAGTAPRIDAPAADC
jgi:quercetin dioxygenase-like cupin family protein